MKTLFSHSHHISLSLPKELIQVAPSHVLEQQTHRLAHGAHAQQLHDVGVIKLRKQARLSLKVYLQIFGRFILQHLHCNQRELLPFQ